MMRSGLLFTVTLLVTLLAANTLRPLAFIVERGKICCLECKKNFCPMVKTNPQDVPACHMNQQGHQTKMKQTCNHSNTEHLYFYNAILVSLLFVISYSAEIRKKFTSVKIEFTDFQPATPPPRFA
jgi:hypothetical protein